MGRAPAFHFDFNPLPPEPPVRPADGILVAGASSSMADPRKIILGVSGGIAAYKSAELVRQLRGEGYAVQVAMTAAAQQFITPLTLASLSGNKVITGLFHDGSDADTLNSAIEHVAVAQSGDLLLAAPATADVLAKFAHGIADDFLTTTHLAFDGPVIVAPAMNTNMWEHPATRENIAVLRGRGVTVVDPGSGDLACGTVGPGRLAGNFRHREPCPRGVRGAWRASRETVLITAGPTREPLDPVRYLSNRSSGRMGFALAEEACRRGARVVIVCGPVSLETPSGCERIDVETTQEMYDAVMARLDGATLAVMAAAAADYRAASPAAQKIKKQGGASGLAPGRNRRHPARRRRAKARIVPRGFRRRDGAPGSQRPQKAASEELRSDRGQSGRRSNGLRHGGKPGADLDPRRRRHSARPHVEIGNGRLHLRYGGPRCGCGRRLDHVRSPAQLPGVLPRPRHCRAFRRSAAGRRGRACSGAGGFCRSGRATPGHSKRYRRLYALPSAQRPPLDRFRQRQSAGEGRLRRRRSRRRRRRSGTAVRRTGGAASDPDDRKDLRQRRVAGSPQRRLHLQRRQMPSARQPRPGKRRDGNLRPVSRAPVTSDRAPKPSACSAAPRPRPCCAPPPASPS